MRDLWIVISIIVFVFVGNFLLKNYYESSGNKIVEEVEKLSAGIENDDENVKKTNMDSIKKKWDDTQKYWILFEYHEHVNTMEDILLECLDNYVDGDKSEFQKTFDKFKRNIEDLKNREEISILNVF